MHPKFLANVSLLALVFSAALVAPSAAQVRPLNEVETRALRNGIYRSSPTLLRANPFDVIVRETRIFAPTIPEESIANIEAHLKGETATQAIVNDLTRLPRYWGRRPAEHFVFWWNRLQRDVDGLPSRAPTRREVDELEAVATTVAERFGLELPRERCPVRIDLTVAVPRVFPSSDLRYGVHTHSPLDRASVARFVLTGAGESEYLLAPLAALHGDCAVPSAGLPNPPLGGPACREKMLEQAWSAVAASGYVPITDGLAAGSVTPSTGDPAFASGLLVVDHLESRLELPAFAELLRAMTPGLSAPEAREAFRRITGLTTGRVDRDLQRQLRQRVHD